MRRRSNRRGRGRGRRGVSIPVGYLFGGAGVLLAIGLIVVLMGSRVISQNNTKCKKNGRDYNATISGCEAKSEYVSKNILIVVGNTKYTPIPKISTSVKKMLRNTLFSDKEINSSITVISATSAKNILGEYENVWQKSIDEITKERDEKDEKTTELDDRLEYIDDAIKDIEEKIKKQPIAGHVDYLSAINRGRNTIDGDVKVIVIGSGISDSGDLDLSNKDILAKLDSNIEEVVNSPEFIQIYSGKEKNLKGAEIFWEDFGTIVSPQRQPTENQIQNLKRMYEEIIEGEGANKKNIDIRIGAGISEEGGIETEEEVKLIEFSLDDNAWAKRWNEGISFSNSDIGFVAQTKHLSLENKNKFKEMIREDVDNSGDIRIEIIGVEAKAGKCPTQRGTEYALARAEEVKNILLEMGVSNDRLVARSWNDKDNIPDECASGRMDSGIQAKNRIVTIRKAEE